MRIGPIRFRAEEVEHLAGSDLDVLQIKPLLFIKRAGRGGREKVRKTHNDIKGIAQVVAKPATKTFTLLWLCSALVVSFFRERLVDDQRRPLALLSAERGLKQPGQICGPPIKNIVNR